LTVKQTTDLNWVAPIRKIELQRAADSDGQELCMIIKRMASSFKTMTALLVLIKLDRWFIFVCMVWKKKLITNIYR